MKISPADGISILIPIYNVNVTDMVAELLEQAALLSVPFEIICLDDFSDPSWKEKNEIIQALPSVLYQELNENIGRSKIRNLLAKKSQYASLLFLDCDSTIYSKYFLEDYWKVQHRPVVVGGRNYPIENSVSPRYLLHWFVGKNREVMDASLRNKFPYRSFMFNNVLIKRSVFIEILLDESIGTYGHEDTKFGYELEQKKIPVYHINNATSHTSLDDTEAFLFKTHQGIVNLYQLILQGYAHDTKLYKTWRLLKVFLLSGIFLFIYTKFIKNRVERNLRSSNPSLFYFDLYKLAALTALSK